MLLNYKSAPGGPKGGANWGAKRGATLGGQYRGSMFCLHPLAPEFMQEIIHQHEGPVTRSQRDFSRPNNNKVLAGQGSFRSFGPIVWNEMLPSHIKNQENFDIFKKQLI